MFRIDRIGRRSLIDLEAARWALDAPGAGTLAVLLGRTEDGVPKNEYDTRNILLSGAVASGTNGTVAFGVTINGDFQKPDDNTFLAISGGLNVFCVGALEVNAFPVIARYDEVPSSGNVGIDISDYAVLPMESYDLTVHDPTGPGETHSIVAGVNADALMGLLSHQETELGLNPLFFGWCLHYTSAAGFNISGVATVNGHKYWNEINTIDPSR